jgi:capsular exopolysaccharide synthesis family protein
MMNPGTSENRAESVDIKEYLAVLLKRKWLVLVCFLLSMAGTTAFLFTRQPIYRANAKLLVTISGGVMPSAEVREEGGGFYATQIDIMMSQTMLKRVQLRMKKSTDEIRENLTNLKISPVRGSDILMITVDSPSADFARDFADSLAAEYLQFRNEDRARASESALLMLTREINRLSQEVKASQDRYFTYAQDNNLPMLKDTAAAWWRAYYINLSVNMSHKAALEGAKAKLAALERSDSAGFLALVNQSQMLRPAEVTPQPAGSTDQSSANATQANLPAERAAPSPAEALAGKVDSADLAKVGAMENQQASSPADGTAVTPSAALPQTDLQKLAPSNMPVIVAEKSVASSYPALPGVLVARMLDLDMTRVTLETKLEQLNQLYRPLHPAVVATRQELENVKQTLKIQMDFARKITKAEVDYLEEDVAASNQTLAHEEAEGLDKSKRVLSGSSFADDLERVRSQYNALLGQLMKIDVGQSFRVRTVSVLEPAIVEPEPVYPKKVKGLLVAAFFGLGLGLALAFFIEYIDDSIKLAEEVERDLQLPFLGMVPAAQWNPDDLSAHRLDKLKQQGGVAEAYRVVRSAIIFSIPREKLRSILLTSAVPREGKTTSCVNLSIGFAQIEERVLLIDADLRRGEIHKYFGFEKDKGLADVLLGEATPEEVIKHSDVPKLDVMTVGSYPANPAELLLGWRLKELLDWAYKHYDRVIIDCTPVMGIADSVILGSAVDGVLFVIWAGRTSRRYVRVAKMTAVSRGAKVFGFVLNNLEPGRVGYYHYYPYYYSYYSRGYYYAHKEEEEAGKGGDIKGMEVPAPKEGQDEIDDVY